MLFWIMLHIDNIKQGVVGNNMVTYLDKYEIWFLLLGTEI